MKVDVTGHHLDVTPALKDYVDSKLERIARHFDNLGKAHVVLTVEKLSQKAEATIHVSGGTVHAVGTGQDLYAAIDGLADKLDRQVKRHKEKLTDYRGPGIQKG
jgi:putative sigma-54 modulation protein